MTIERFLPAAADLGLLSIVLILPR